MGFVAPLWEIHDEPARLLAEVFYQAALEEGQNVAEVLHQHRLTYDRAGTTTPLAYIYYGHPALKLRLATEEMNHD